MLIATKTASLPFAVDEKLDPNAINEQTQGAVCAQFGDLDCQCLLPPAQLRAIRRRPVLLPFADHPPDLAPGASDQQAVDVGLAHLSDRSKPCFAER